ncbi:MAG: hypothetical protein AB1742_02580 [bacterium]
MLKIRGRGMTPDGSVLDRYVTDGGSPITKKIRRYCDFFPNYSNSVNNSG